MKNNFILFMWRFWPKVIKRLDKITDWINKEYYKDLENL